MSNENSEQDQVQGDANSKQVKVPEEVISPEEIYYLIKLKRRFKRWQQLQSSFFVQLFIAAIICILSLGVGVYALYLQMNNEHEGKETTNIISTTAIGLGSIVTLCRNLWSLQSLMTKNDNLESLEKLYKDEIEKTGLKIVRCEDFWKYNIEDYQDLVKYEKKDRKQLSFMKGLIRHMKYMMIYIAMWVALASCIFIILAIISVFTLISKHNDRAQIFQIVVYVLIIFSALCLWSIISAPIVIKIIIPMAINKAINKQIEYINLMKNSNKIIGETNDSNDDNLIYEDKIPFRHLLPVKYQPVINLLLCIFYILSIPFLACIGLVTPGTKNLSKLHFEFKLRRTEVNYIELEGIKRLLMGLHTSTNSHNKSESS
ncbi:hypothetical protein F8M41_013300 [Gigaspora margarita]|uniref:Transmembrane protein n=1 Tax=Gigaspora margarita TaxID=4874 RepID=A0A8H4EV33_GIGMA|nr:hypothetical protein F8M41_013300 [Gigaspora margarita]